MKSQAEIFRHALTSEVERLGVTLSTEQLDALALHYELIRKWNPRIRIVGTTDPERAARELFADSLLAARFAGRVVTAIGGRATPRIIDIGSGAGLPGIIIKILHSQWNVAVVESNARKVSFLKSLVHELRLGKADVIHGRAEVLAHDESLREQFDIAFCRAVASPAAACELALPFVKVGGSFVAQTGKLQSEDLAQFREVAELLGARHYTSIGYKLTGVESTRSLIAIEKVTPTSLLYPRNTRKMQREPLA